MRTLHDLRIGRADEVGTQLGQRFYGLHSVTVAKQGEQVAGKVCGSGGFSLVRRHHATEDGGKRLLGELVIADRGSETRSRPRPVG